ncbi:MAG: hypothetical protein R6X25_07285 [Candidatus Krumholzibacteriia bacterium]
MNQQTGARTSRTLRTSRTSRSSPGAQPGSSPAPAIEVTTDRPGLEPGALVAGASRHWELWLLRSLLPEAGPADLAEMRARRRRFADHERAALARLLAGDTAPLHPGRRFVAGLPDLLRRGLVVTMHVGPYQFLPEPFLTAGVSPGILLDEEAERRLRPRAEFMIRRLCLRAQPEWIVATQPAAIRRMMRVLREERPLLAFLDGNAGQGGFAATRRDGMPYRLPGREIRMRTGLARLVCRLECPVRPVVVRWSAEGAVTWTGDIRRTYRRTDDPRQVTRELCDWGFGAVLADPAQWGYWEMIRAAASCFAPVARPAAGLPGGLHADYERAFAICLKRAPDCVRVLPAREAEVWNDSVLVDLEEDRFYASEGLTSAALVSIRDERPTLAALAERYGEEWVRRHVLRLCLLGLARLGGGAGG